jgi:hypothetical protein
LISGNSGRKVSVSAYSKRVVIAYRFLWWEQIFKW